VCKIKALQSQLDAMTAILKQLKSDKEQAKAQESISGLKIKMEAAIGRLKTNGKISEKEITALYDSLFTACNADFKMLTAVLDNQKNKDEEERLRKIQEEILRAQRQKEEEERQRKLDEAQHKQKLEIEARRKLEEEEHRKLELAEAKNRAATEAKLKLQQEELLRQQQAAEQERRDHDLASRLATELGTEVDPVKSSPKRAILTSSSSNASSPSPPPALNKKHDLSKWKYAELRDAINTSCDLELLEACREEFHRRLKVRIISFCTSVTVLFVRGR
jgi:myosin-6